MQLKNDLLIDSDCFMSHKMQELRDRDNIYSRPEYRSDFLDREDSICVYLLQRENVLSVDRMRDMYPGVDASKRLRLLDNGVVAYAERKGWLIEITKDYVVSPKGS